MARFPNTEPEKGADGWVSHFTTSTFKLCRGVTLYVTWRSAGELFDTQGKSFPAGYWVSVLDRRLASPIAEMQEAKAQAFRLARKVANEMIEALDKPGPDGRAWEFIPTKES